MLEQLQAYKKGGNPLKDQWLTYIDNKAVDLDTRWAAFLEAPAEWKIHATEASPPYACLREIGLDSSYDDFLMDRHQTNDVDTDVDHIESMIGDTDYNDTLSEEHIIAMKEEIIAARLGSWTWDW